MFCVCVCVFRNSPTVLSTIRFASFKFRWHSRANPPSFNNTRTAKSAHKHTNTQTHTPIMFAKLRKHPQIPRRILCAACAPAWYAICEAISLHSQTHTHTHTRSHYLGRTKQPGRQMAETRTTTNTTTTNRLDWMNGAPKRAQIKFSPKSTSLPGFLVVVVVVVIHRGLDLA